MVPAVTTLSLTVLAGTLAKLRSYRTLALEC